MYVYVEQIWKDKPKSWGSSQNFNSKNVNPQNVNSQNVNSQIINFPKCQLPKCQLPDYQLSKMSTPKMSTPKIYILTKYTIYLSYFITYQTALQTGSFNQYQAHLTLCDTWNGIMRKWKILMISRPTLTHR